MGNYTIFEMFKNPRRDRQGRNFTSVPKILDLKSSSEHWDVFRKLSLGAPDILPVPYQMNPPLWTPIARKVRLILTQD